VTGTAPVKLEGIDCYVILSVISGFGKTLSIRTTLNDQSYSTQVDALFETMELEKTKTSLISKNTATAQTNEAGKFGAMMYITPGGWREQQFQDGVVFKPLDLPAGEHLAIQIMQPLISAGSIEQALVQSYDEAATMYKATQMRNVNGGAYEEKEAKKSFKGWEYIRCSGGIQIENGTPYSDEYGLDLFVIKINNRFERVAILQIRKNCNLSRYYPADRLSYHNDIENFLFALKFTDWGEPALKSGTFNADGIVGIWEGISLSVGAVTTSQPLGVGYRVYTPIFLSNGHAYFGSKLPSEGLDELNPWIRAETARRDWGTYIFSNGRGVLKMPYGDIPLRMENNKFIITANHTDHVFHKLNSVNGATFNGTYALRESNGKTPSITFTSDGRFTDHGAIQVLYHEYVDCMNPGLTAGSGSYEVKNYSILFNYTDGRKIKIAFLGSGYDIKNQSPATLTISSNEDEMVRQ
jgi:hypothetical protein